MQKLLCTKKRHDSVHNLCLHYAQIKSVVVGFHELLVTVPASPGDLMAQVGNLMCRWKLLSKILQLFFHFPGLRLLFSAGLSCLVVEASIWPHLFAFFCLSFKIPDYLDQRLTCYSSNIQKWP